MQLFLFNWLELSFSTQNRYILHKNGIYWFIISYRHLVFSGKCGLLYFISNSSLNLWLLWTFLERAISPIDAFYFLSGCFFPSSKILNSDYQTWFNELRVGVFPSVITQYPVHASILPSEIITLRGQVAIPPCAWVLALGWTLHMSNMQTNK